MSDVFKSTKVFEVNNENETAELAQDLGKKLKGGELITLDGDLGAGKTFFTGAMCESLYIERKFVSSPTFVIMKKYNGIFTTYHWDFYRINSEEELYAADFSEYLKEKNSITIVEWASMYRNCWLDYFPRIEIKIEFGEKDGKRRIEITRAG